MMRVQIKPELLRWARERSGLDRAELAHRFPKLDAWDRRESSPTLKQLESFAKATHTPVGYLFLQEPPVERVPIPDFRTAGNARVGRPSPDLLDTIYMPAARGAVPGLSVEWLTKPTTPSQAVERLPPLPSLRPPEVEEFG